MFVWTLRDALQTEDGIFERSLAFSLPAPLYLNVENDLNQNEAAAVLLRIQHWRQRPHFGLHCLQHWARGARGGWTRVTAQKFHPRYPRQLKMGLVSLPPKSNLWTTYLRTHVELLCEVHVTNDILAFRHGDFFRPAEQIQKYTKPHETSTKPVTKPLVFDRQMHETTILLKKCFSDI